MTTNQSRTFTGENPKAWVAAQASLPIEAAIWLDHLDSASYRKKVLPTVPIEMYGDDIQCTNITLKTMQQCSTQQGNWNTNS